MAQVFLQRPIGQQLANRFARNVFKNDVLPPVGRSEIKNHFDEWMVEFGQQLRFGPEPRSCLVISQNPWRKHLDRYLSIQLLVARKIHHAHATRANLSSDSVV